MDVSGSTQLVAGLRILVIDHFGDTVEVPDSLGHDALPANGLWLTEAWEKA